jgi:alpha-tubulin suppressor-like RCC1 family protein
MTINIGNLELILQQKISATSNAQDLLLLTKALAQLKFGTITSIATFSLLPNALTYTGSLYFVEADRRLYWSTGATWYVILTDMLGQAWTWGQNTCGRLGDGTITNRSSPGTTAGGGSDWSIIRAGGAHNAAIKTDNTLWTWGGNGCGQLGNGTITDRSSPGTTAGGGTNWASVSGGSSHTAGVKKDGTLWTWGGNGNGRLGDGTITDRSSPGTTAGGGTNWSLVSAGDSFTAGIKTDGTLWTWGYNCCGRLGDGTIIARSSPGTTAGGGTNWSSVSAGCSFAAGIKTDGTLWTWGFNCCGQLGDGTLASRTSPGPTAGGGTNWNAVSAGYRHTAGVKMDGTLWTWGGNCYGRLGNGTLASRVSPGITAGGGTTWNCISLGPNHTSATKTDGTLWTWGWNPWGHLGDGTVTARSSPVTTAGGGTNWSSVSAGISHTAAISKTIF